MFESSISPQSRTIYQFAEIAMQWIVVLDSEFAILLLPNSPVDPIDYVNSERPIWLQLPAV